MTKARDLANIISGGFTTSDLPTLTASEIPNLDASKITTGSIADARIPASAVSQHATSFNDNAIVNDLSTLGLRVHTQENLNVSTTNSTSFDVFNDSNGVASFTTSSRDSDNKLVSTKIFGSASLIDFDDIDGTGLDVKYKTSGNLASSGNMNLTSFTNLSDHNLHPDIDTVYQLNNNWSGNGAMVYAVNTPKSTADSTSHFMILDFGAKYQFGGVWYIGKQNGYGDMRKMQFQQSLDDSSYSAIDMSGVTTTSTSYSGSSLSSGSKSGGTVGSASSDGSFILAQHGGIYFNSANTMDNFPTTEMRYLKIIFHNQYTGTANANAGFHFNMTKKPVSFSATGNFVGANITAPSTVSKMGAVITYTETGTNTLNTDIVMQLSSDGGSNFTTATLTALPNFATGIKMAKVNDLSLTGGTGTSCTYKISFANQSEGSKVANIKCVSLQY